MAISFINSSFQGSAANTDTTIGLPGGIAVDDLILVAYAIGDNDSVDQNVAMVTAGYTEVADLFSDDVGDVSFGVYYKYWNGTDGTAVCDALSAGTDAAVAGVLMVFRGVALVADGGPFQVAASPATGINTMHPNPPASTNAAGDWIVCAGAGANLVVGTGLISALVTLPTNYTTNAVEASFGDTSDVSIGMGYRASGSAANEDPGTITITGSDSADYAWAAVTMALKPGGANADVTPTTVVATTTIDTPTIEATDPAPELILTPRNL